jgi:predicted TIM-barrel enzyme
MTFEANMSRAQILRQRCNRTFADKNIPDVVATVEMLTADAILALPGMSEDAAVSMADAIAADIRNIIRERFAVKQGGH